MSDEVVGCIAIIIGVVVVLAILWGVPLLSIWSLNTLFSLTIPYTLKTWGASLFLIGFSQILIFGSSFVAGLVSK